MRGALATSRASTRPTPAASPVLRRAPRSDAAEVTTVTYVVVHQKTGRPVLVYAGPAVEQWTLEDYRKRLADLGYGLFELLEGPMPVGMLGRAVENLEED